tara:strand:+ start:727 stop:1734 length:1008 start_codon:yes stop_codon:yes gene_type:complete
MSQPRRHHFVQAEHIRQFTNENGTIWVYSKDGKTFQVAPEAIFWKRDLNSYETPDGLNTDFEPFVTEFENETFPAISRIIKSETLSDEDLNLATAYLALSRFRNPSLQSGIIENHRQIATTAAKLSDRNGKFDDLGPMPGFENRSLSELLDDGTIEFSINNSVYIDNVVSMTKQSHTLLANGFGWNLVKSPRGRVIISDHPLTFVHPGKDFGVYGIPLGGDGCEVAFPLSKHLYLVGLWKREFEAVESEDFTDELNRRQALFANRHIASGLKNRNWEELAFRNRNHAFQTKAETLNMGDEAMHILTSNIFALEGRNPPAHLKPTSKLRPIFPANR